MSNFHKFGVAFLLALALHLTIVLLFGINFFSEAEIVKQKPLPEIIQASILDDGKILEEAKRLKIKEENKRNTQKKQQQELENKRKKEQQLLQNAKKQRIQEEKKVKQLEQKRKDNELKEKQKLKKNKLKEERKIKEEKKQKALEAAHLAKIKKQKIVEKKRLDGLRKAKEKKQVLEKIAKENAKKETAKKEKTIKEKAKKAAEKKRKVERLAAEQKKQALIAQQKAQAAEQAAKIKREAEAAQAKLEQDRKATISATAAIQRKVNNRWIKPLSSSKGLSSTIRVKLLPSGDVMNARVIRSSGDSIFDRSAENAVLKASPLPVPKDRALFTKQFRSFTFEFKPE